MGELPRTTLVPFRTLDYALTSLSANEDAGLKKAITLLLRGDLEGGFSLYRACLAGGRVADQPIGAHLILLQQAGHDETARRLLKLALHHGVNVAARAGWFSSEREAAAEYEQLFAQGIANSRMVSEHLRVLAKLGRFTEIRDIIDPDQCLRMVQLKSRHSSVAGLAAAVEQLLIELEPTAEKLEAVKSVRKMRKVKHLSELDDHRSVKLTNALNYQAERYLNDWRRSHHPLAHLVPTRWRLHAWGLISRGDGYNMPHFHHKGWATGVYYPTTLEDGEGGELFIGRPAGVPGNDSDWGAMRIRPRAGLLVLMPSYYMHWTVPLERPGLRASVAFDLLPEA